MAKIARKTQKIFGSSAGGLGIVEYGSPASGTPVYDTDLDNIQTADWLTGWAAAALAGTEIPTFQDFNAIHYVSTSQLGYLLQEGIPEYDSGTEYHANSVVKKTATYELYGSKINTNTGNALPSAVDDANWKYLGDLAELASVSGLIPAGTEGNIITYDAAGNLSLVSTGTAGQVLTSNGAGAEPTMESLPAAGKVVQVVYVQDGDVATGTTIIPKDDTIPQQTEGDQYMTLSITPTSASNILKIDVLVAAVNSTSTSDSITAALFQDSTSDCLASALGGRYFQSGRDTQIYLSHHMIAGTSSPTTFKVRVGADNSGTTTFNGGGGTRIYGGTLASGITITEIAV